MGDHRARGGREIITRLGAGVHGGGEHAGTVPVAARMRGNLSGVESVFDFARDGKNATHAGFGAILAADSGLLPSP